MGVTLLENPHAYAAQVSRWVFARIPPFDPAGGRMTNHAERKGAEPTHGTVRRTRGVPKLRPPPQRGSVMRAICLVAIPVLLAVSLSACTPAQVRLPEGFGANAVTYDVSGHSPRRFNEPVRFGPYSALEMREGSTFAWSASLGTLGVSRTTRPYAYTLTADGLSPVEVQCRMRAWTAGAGRESQRTTVDMTALAGPLLACGLRADGHDAQLLEVAREGNRLHGRLLAPWGREYTVRSLHDYEGSAITGMVPTGYAIADGGSTVAVVDVLNHGRVHLERALDDNQGAYFAAAAAALLLLDPELGG